MTGPLGKLFRVLELRAAVTFSKGMDMIHVAQYRSCTVGEPLGASAPEIPRRHDPAMYVRHARPDEPSRLKPTAALGDLDGANFARPFIDVLKQMAVDRPQMIEVEIARRHRFEKPLRDEPALRCFQRRASLIPSLF